MSKLVSNAEVVSVERELGINIEFENIKCSQKMCLFSLSKIMLQNLALKIKNPACSHSRDF